MPVFTGNIDSGEAVRLTADEAEFESTDGELVMTFKQLRNTAGPDGSVWAGVVTIEPVTINYTFKGHETIHILEGEVSIAVDDRPAVELRAGDIASFTKGSRSVWVVRKRLREFFVLSGT